MSSPHSNLLTDVDVWAARIAARADLGDERRNARLGHILASLAANPHDSIPQASGSFSQAKAMYRFFANQAIEPGDVLQPLVDDTSDLLRGLPVVLAVQDSSSTNYSTLKGTRGLGALNDSAKARGLHVHTTLAVRGDGVTLGLLDQIYWARSDERTAADRKHRPIEDKESRKWLDGIDAAENAVECLPVEQRPRLIHVMDREGDIHEVLQRVSESPHFAIIRCAQNRSVDDPTGKAYAALDAAAVLGTITVQVPRLSHLQDETEAAADASPATTASETAASPRPSAASGQRRVTLQLRAVTLTITPNPNKHPHRQAVTWTLIEAREINAPAGVTPLHWRLWTNLPALTLDDVQEVLRYYGFRWRIEDFHLTLKSGCRIEKLELEEADRLIKASMIYSAVALRIVAMRDLARLQPEASCATFLSSDEWQSLYVRFAKEKLTASTQPPTVKQALKWIGQLGGHLARKRDGMPGVRTLWRGFRDLSLLAAGFRAARSLH